MKSELARIAEFIAGLELSGVPDPVKEQATLHILDSIGAAVGAADHPQVRSVAGAWLRENGSGEVSVWGQGRSASLSAAVFLNGMMGHTLEMDDVHTNSKTHIGTVVVPAAWGLAQRLGASGRDCLLAVICGYEVMSRIGMAFGVSAHRDAGWHATATAGTFGAAAACSKLLGLDAEKTTYALGLAGAQSFGTWGFLGDGATSKVLNPARASQVGLESALLAQAGMTGPEHILTAEDGGILSMMSNAPEADLAVKDLGKVWQLLYVDYKPYPSCRSTHCAVDGTLALCREYGLTADQIDHVEVETYLVGYKQCAVSEGSLAPRSPVNAKFSTPYTVACAILYGEVTLKQFTQEAIEAPEARELLRRVQVRPAEAFTRVYPSHWGCKVMIFGKDGTVYEKYVEDASGSVDNPLMAAQVKTKAVSLMRETCGGEAETIADALLKLEQLDKLPAL